VVAAVSDATIVVTAVSDATAVAIAVTQQVYRNLSQQKGT
jgi:hypothetical protein